MTGYEPARQLGDKLIRYTRDHAQLFDSEGRWLVDPEAKGEKLWESGMDSDLRKEYEKELKLVEHGAKGLRLGGHGHGHGIALLSVLDYGLALGDRDLLAFSKASYKWAKNPGSIYGVSTLVGWFPEWFVPGYPSCESCTIGDMLGIGLKLTAAGFGDYWDDADRWVRNHFVEQQLTSVDWVYELASHEPKQPVGPFQTAERTPERNVGDSEAGQAATSGP